MMDSGMGWGFGWLGMILFWIVPLILALLGIKYLFAGGGAGSGSAAPDSSHSSRALSRLEERYASGEIEREEFLQKRDDILGK